MRFLSSPVRTFVTAASLVLLWLMSALPASAAPGGRYSGPLCDPQATTLRKLARQPKSIGGPLKAARTRHLVGLTGPSARLQRGTRTTFDGDDAAIQNDAPAARIDDEGRGLPSLCPLDLLARPVAGSLRSPAFSPRAPRGPPLAAA
jgi:hypothetical protein